MVRSNFELIDFFRDLEDLGLTDVLLPFLLIFTIIFAILQKSKILGDQKKNLNVVVALVIGLLVVIPHVTNSYPANADVVEIMNKAIPSVSLVVVAILMLFIIIGLFGGEADWTGPISGWVAVIAFVIIVWIFGAASDWWNGWRWFNDFFGSQTVAVIIIILVFALIIGFITAGEKTGGRGNMLKKIGDEIGRFFKGGG
jgi:hypothetical protein